MSIRLSALADQDLLAIAAYLADDDRLAARELLTRFEGRLSQLSRFPELGRPRPDIAENVRGLLISPYLAIYRVESSDVVVLRILHTSRDLRGTVLQ